MEKKEKWVRVLVTEGRVLHRDAGGTLRCGYANEEMDIPETVYQRNRRNCEIVKDDVPALPVAPVVTTEMKREKMVAERLKRQQENKVQALRNREERAKRLAAQNR